MALMVPTSLSWSVRMAAFHTRNLAAVISVSISANMNPMAWKLAMGWPNCLRLSDHFLAVSQASRAMPTAAEATPARVRLKVFMAMRKPMFSLPTTFSTGTATSLYSISTWQEARWPILGSSRPMVTPGVSAGTTMADMPRAPRPGSVLQKTVWYMACLPLVMKRFFPLMTYLSPCFTAVVATAPASEPASGSVRQKAASPRLSMRWPKTRFLRSSEAPTRRGVRARLLASMQMPMPEHAAPSSSLARQPSKELWPAPPYIFGIAPLMTPSS